MSGGIISVLHARSGEQREHTRMVAMSRSCSVDLNLATSCGVSLPWLSRICTSHGLPFQCHQVLQGHAPSHSALPSFLVHWPHTKGRCKNAYLEQITQLMLWKAFQPGRVRVYIVGDCALTQLLERQRSHRSKPRSLSASSVQRLRARMNVPGQMPHASTPGCCRACRYDVSCDNDATLH